MSKKVVDRDGKELGKVVRVEDFFDSMTMEQATPFAIIEIPHIFKQNGLFPLPLISAKQFQIMEDMVYLDITKREFKRMYKLYEVERKLKVKAAKFGEVKAEDAAIAKMFWGKV